MKAEHINHAEYPKRLKKKSDAELHYIIEDARQAIQTMPRGHKAGYYADEISYCDAELKRRKRNPISAKNFVDTLRVNVDNSKLSNKDFRAYVRKTLSVVA